VTNNQRRDLANQAMLKSIDVRLEGKLDLMSPICIYELCDEHKVQVRFVDINMEGAYVANTNPLILISALRPFPRRIFTCAHELGHHIFGHRSTVDQLIKDQEKTKGVDPNEFLVDCFAGFLLMPTLGVRRAFVSRGWSPKDATPTQIFTIACSFGVGYETLLNHMAYSLRMIGEDIGKTLLKKPLPSIRQEILGIPLSDPLVVADEKWLLPTIDVEVGTRVLVPANATGTSKLLTMEQDLAAGRLFRADRPGIERVYCPNTNWAVFVRISRFQFEGLSKYRHFEEIDNE
jgi:Zn-dependent peptidase ImmA (M78 family)